MIWADEAEQFRRTGRLMTLGEAMGAEEAARWLDEIMEPSEGEPEELIRYSAAWEQWCDGYLGAYRLGWHSITCACESCLKSDFIAYFCDDIYRNSLEVCIGPGEILRSDIRDQRGERMARQS